MHQVTHTHRRVTEAQRVTDVTLELEDHFIGFKVHTTTHPISLLIEDYRVCCEAYSATVQLPGQPEVSVDKGDTDTVTNSIDVGSIVGAVVTDVWPDVCETWISIFVETSRGPVRLAVYVDHDDCYLRPTFHNVRVHLNGKDRTFEI